MSVAAVKRRGGQHRRAEFTHRYLPRCSPDLSPIEPASAKMKAWLRQATAHSVAALRAALDAVTAGGAAGFTPHAGCGASVPTSL